MKTLRLIHNTTREERTVEILATNKEHVWIRWSIAGGYYVRFKDGILYKPLPWLADARDLAKIRIQLGYSQCVHCGEIAKPNNPEFLVNSVCPRTKDRVHQWG